MCNVTARRHAQQPDREPVSAGKSAPVAAKAAAIDAAQARPLTWKTIVKRALTVAVVGAALYLVLPKLIAVIIDRFVPRTCSDFLPGRAEVDREERLRSGGDRG